MRFLTLVLWNKHVLIYEMFVLLIMERQKNYQIDSCQKMTVLSYALKIGKRPDFPDVTQT